MKTWNSMAGWRTTNVRAEWLSISLCVLVHVAEAAPRDHDPLPDMEMLEFLGSLEMANGQRVDPLELEDMPLPETDKQVEQSRERKPGEEFGRESRQERVPAPKTTIPPRRLGRE